MVLNPNFDISIKAINELSGIDIGKEKFIRNKTDASKVFNIVTTLIGWLYGNKKVGIVIGIDNIESLLGTKKEEKFINYILIYLDGKTLNKISKLFSFI